MEDGRIVNIEEGKKFAEEFGLPYIETSAKNGININETFEDIVEKIDKIFGNMPRVIKNPLYKVKNKNKCCWKFELWSYKNEMVRQLPFTRIIIIYSLIIVSLFNLQHL